MTDFEPPPLQLRALSAGYRGAPVLRAVDLELYRGELTGLIGPNGSGKSTLIRAIAGLQDNVGGSVIIGGHDVATEPVAARAQLGYAVEPGALPPLLSGRQCIELLLRLRGVDDSLDDSLRLADQLRLTPWLDGAISSYSLGTRQKLAIVQAMVGRPRLIVLDEVLNGLDPLAAYALKRALRTRCDAGAAVLLATHGLEVAERFLDRAVLLLDGRIAEDWDASALNRFRADPAGGLEHALVHRLAQH